MLDQIDIQKIVAIARDAGDAIMKIYETEFTVEYKDDATPLTEADREAHTIIAEGLNGLRVQLPVISEEGKTIAYDERKSWEYFWMVDPLDGTKEFVQRNEEFTVNIALIHRDFPVLGVVYAPATGELYWAKQGEGAFKNHQRLPLYINAAPQKLLRVVASKSHGNAETQNFIDQLGKTTETVESMSRGSSLKLCMVAEGSADIYPRMGPTMEWDTAAADAIVRESGKNVNEYPSKRALLYNKMDLLNGWFIVR